MFWCKSVIKELRDAAPGRGGRRRGAAQLTVELWAAAGEDVGKQETGSWTSAGIMSREPADPRRWKQM